MDNNKDVRENYDDLIRKSKFNAKVLITTALLDNGININDADVTNIVIDVFDRTSFIQMLGRLRVKNSAKITLYFRDYSTDDLKKLLRRKEEDLLDRLNNDLLTVNDRKERFDSKNFFYADDPNTFSAYNPCAIYQLIDSINLILCLLKSSEGTFWNDTISAIRTRIYNYYKFNPNGIDKSWSRSLVDMLESSDGESWRESERIHDETWGEFSDRYAYRFDDSFTRFIFSDLIPGYYMGLVEKYAKAELEAKWCIIDGHSANQFCLWVQHKTGGDYDGLSCSEKLKLVSSFIVKMNWGLPITLDLLDTYMAMALESQQFADNKPSNSIQEQLMWIEMPDATTSSIETISTAPNDQKGMTDEQITWIQTHAINKQEIEQNRLKSKNGDPAKYIPLDFLERCGIQKDSPEDSAFAKCVFGKEHLTNCLKKSVDVEGDNYTLASYVANGERHPVFYVFLKMETQILESIEE